MPGWDPVVVLPQQGSAEPTVGPLHSAHQVHYTGLEHIHLTKGNSRAGAKAGMPVESYYCRGRWRGLSGCLLLLIAARKNGQECLFSSQAQNTGQCYSLLMVANNSWDEACRPVRRRSLVQLCAGSQTAFPEDLLFNTDDTQALLKDMRGQEHLVLFSEHVELYQQLSNSMNRLPVLCSFAHWCHQLTLLVQVTQASNRHGQARGLR